MPYIHCSKQSEPGHSDHIFRVIVKEEEHRLHYPTCTAEESTLAKPQTNMLQRSEWISLWNSKHDPVTGCMDSGAIEAHSFINLERKACVHNIWKCFPWTRSTWQCYYPRHWHAPSWERLRGLCAPQKWFSRHWYLMEQQEHSSTDISRAALHMEAIKSNAVLRHFPQPRRNHQNPQVFPLRPFCCY